MWEVTSITFLALYLWETSNSSQPISKEGEISFHLLMEGVWKFFQTWFKMTTLLSLMKTGNCVVNLSWADQQDSKGLKRVPTKLTKLLWNYCFIQKCTGSSQYSQDCSPNLCIRTTVFPLSMTPAPKPLAGQCCYLSWRVSLI